LAVEGVIATLLAVGVIAALMVIGIRTKLPPPDPDWREHLPPPPPPPPRWWQIVWFVRFAFLPIGFVITLAGHRVLGGVVMSFYFLITVGLWVDAVRGSVRHRRELKRLEDAAGP
jgi:hypothetical protein